METKAILDNFLKDFKHISISFKDKIMIVELNRPKALNAMSERMFFELYNLFSNMTKIVLKEIDVRCVILKGANNNFTAGLDLKSDLVMSGFGSSENIEPGRRAFWFHEKLEELQKSLSAIEYNPLPVICAIDGYCIGGATSIISCCDMRFCTKDAKISIKEIDIGLTADIGVLQRMGKQIGNDSLYRQYCFTGEIFNGKQALEMGLVNKVFNNEADMMDYVYELAKIISTKSPIVLWGIKKTINFARDNKVETSLDMIKHLNSALIQSEDIITAVTATIKKEKKAFPKF